MTTNINLNINTDIFNNGNFEVQTVSSTKQASFSLKKGLNIVSKQITSDKNGIKVETNEFHSRKIK